MMFFQLKRKIKILNKVKSLAGWLHSPSGDIHLLLWFSSRLAARFKVSFKDVLNMSVLANSTKGSRGYQFSLFLFQFS